MTKKNIDQKLESILMIITIICSGLLIIIPLNPTIHTAFAVSTWTQTSDRDFSNGTMNNLTVVGSGDLAELRIDLSGLQTWTNKTPINKPIGRCGHAMASIYGTDKVLLFGGEDSTNLKYNDTWVYDLSENSWTQKSPVNKPSARGFHAMASIYGDDKVVLFGGYYNPISEIYDDTWVYDLSNDTWTKKMTTPVSRYSHAMASIYGDDKV
ncbi:MAG: hypothetical protein KAJ51_12125, partial [Thermoplasmata archaeon]|nr:hypothetical protein [Thermoplasmata archaeon]